MQVAGLAALAPTVKATARTRKTTWPIEEGADTPKLCMGVRGSTESERAAYIHGIRQLGVTHVLQGGGRIPWDETELRAKIKEYKEAGVTLYNQMIGGFPNTIYGKPGRDEEIDKVMQSIRAAGRAGLPVIEYNWYAHRAKEGYYKEVGRAGTGYTAYNYDRMKDLEPPETGAYTEEQLWANITYFHKAVVPVAEEYGVRLALHPNDPPVANSRGSEQIIARLSNWKRLLRTVPSTSNGMTYDSGVTTELGEDAVSWCRYLGERDCINHVHYRNVQVRKPYNDYTEVFPDEGEADMFGVMKELVRVGYTGVIYPEHPRGFDYDETQEVRSSYPGGGAYTGYAYNVAYARAMLQAALSS